MPSGSQLADPATLEHPTDAALGVEPLRREARVPDRTAAGNTRDPETRRIAGGRQPPRFQDVHLVLAVLAMEAVPFEEPDRGAADGWMEEFEPGRQSERGVMTKRQVDHGLCGRNESAKTESAGEQR